MTDLQLHYLGLVESHLLFCKESIRAEKPFDAEDYANLALEYLKVATGEKRNVTSGRSTRGRPRRGER